MTIPNNITKSHLIEATERIILEGIPSGAQSTTCDVIYKNNFLPPKLIVSYANKYPNDEELDRNSFKGGVGTDCFNLLEENGFVIIKKRNFKKEFEEWLKENTKLSCKSILNYSGALKTFNEFSKKFNIREIFYWKNEDIRNNQKKFLENQEFKSKDKKGKNMYSGALEHYIKFILQYDNSNIKSTENFDSSKFQSSLGLSNLSFKNQLITRYIASLTTKPFVLLSGLSGSGKTKLAQAFSQWICESDNQYKIIPVGADWTNREPLLGYVNALDNNEYIIPENGALELLIEANKPENSDKPYFLILDEMNLSHVERYFADFLSVMESKDKFKLHSDKDNKKSNVPHELGWPKNLFVVGTVNIDETTYMFSPKVLDRANVIEFRVDEGEIENFLNQEDKEIKLENLEKQGASMAGDFLQIVNSQLNTESSSAQVIKIDETLNKTLVSFFIELQKVGAEFGYRTAMEISKLVYFLSKISKDKMPIDEKIDIAIMQKLLPKLHGSRRKLMPVLEALEKLCLGIYPLSLEKIKRMKNNAIDNGFASYAEA